jgi:hypothetical protein
VPVITPIASSATITLEQVLLRARAERVPGHDATERVEEDVHVSPERGNDPAHSPTWW